VRVDGARVKLFIVGGKYERHPGMRDPSQRGRDADEIRSYELDADKDLEIRLPVKAGARSVTATFIKTNWGFEGPLRPPLPVTSWSYFLCGSVWYSTHCEQPAVESIDISGPYGGSVPSETPARRKLFVCSPGRRQSDEERCARRIVSTLARRAYRRPPTDVDLESLLDAYRAGRTDHGFEAGIGVALQAILASPNFLYRSERDRPHGGQATAYAVTDSPNGTSSERPGCQNGRCVACWGMHGPPVW
jgi:hypothetical protein